MRNRLTIANPNVAPSNSKTSETVVEVGNPKVLKTSNKITSVSIVATMIHIIAANVKF